MWDLLDILLEPFGHIWHHLGWRSAVVVVLILGGIGLLVMKLAGV